MCMECASCATSPCRYATSAATRLRTAFPCPPRWLPHATSGTLGESTAEWRASLQLGRHCTEVSTSVVPWAGYAAWAHGTQAKSRLGQTQSSPHCDTESLGKQTPTMMVSYRPTPASEQFHFTSCHVHVPVRTAMVLSQGYRREWLGCGPRTMHVTRERSIYWSTRSTEYP